MTIEKLKKEYPNLQIKDLNGGCNIYLPGDLVTVWFKKQKFFSNQLKVWRRFSGDEDILTIINVLGNLKLKSTVNAQAEEATDNSPVQACIEHIQKKYEAFVRSNPKDHQTAVMLKTIKSELYQYL